MEMLLAIIHGLAIGVIVSAPMGPTGMLCIQRTLNKGRAAGFFTGVGAALSDLLYCFLAGVSISIIIDFINLYKTQFEILGCIAMICFGIYIARKNPSKSLAAREGKPQKNNYLQDFATGFLITFSNPLILGIILGLYAQFNFPTPHFTLYHYIAGFLAILVGALIWWFVITYLVNKVRTHFNLRSIWIINVIIGVVICVISLLALGKTIFEIFA